jgi:dolichol-phosphate mannosyltransferase
MISALTPRSAFAGQLIDLPRPNARPAGQLDFSLIVPTYNERENLAQLFTRLGKVLAKYEFEVILVDDDSPDETWAEAQRFQHHYKWLRVIRRRGERGLSSAVVCGFRHARGKILGVMDADLQHDHTRLPELLRQMKRADFAVATRRAVGGSDGKWSWARRFVSHSATLLAKIVAGVPLSDPMSGFFMLRREIFTAIDDWAMHPRGYKLLVYLYARASQCFGRSNVRLIEIGYEFGERQHGRSKFSPRVIMDFVAMLFDLRLHPRHAIARPALLPVR